MLSKKSSFKRAAARQGWANAAIALGLSAAYLAAFAGWALGLPSLEYWDFVSLFTFLMLVGRWTQERAIEANRRRLPPGAPTVRAVPVYAAADATTLSPVIITARGATTPKRSTPNCAVPVGRATGSMPPLPCAWPIKR